MTKVSNASEKIKAIAEKFSEAEEVAESILVDTEVLDSTATDIIEHKTDYHPIDIMTVEQMHEDFKFSRETLRESITFGRMVLESAALNMLADKSKASDTTAFAELTTAVLNGVKTNATLYRDFSIVLLNIKKINTTEISNVNNLHIHDNTKVISPVDLIEELKKISTQTK